MDVDSECDIKNSPSSRPAGIHGIATLIGGRSGFVYGLAGERPDKCDAWIQARLGRLRPGLSRNRTDFRKPPNQLTLVLAPGDTAACPRLGLSRACGHACHLRFDRLTTSLRGEIHDPAADVSSFQHSGFAA